jgi:hypothetical protein
MGQAVGGGEARQPEDLAPREAEALGGGLVGEQRVGRPRRGGRRRREPAPSDRHHPLEVTDQRWQVARIGLADGRLEGGEIGPIAHPPYLDPSAATSSPRIPSGRGGFSHCRALPVRAPTRTARRQGTVACQVRGLPSR